MSVVQKGPKTTKQPSQPVQMHAATADWSRGLRASPKPNRLSVAIRNSKLSQPREESEGCHILQFTERSDLLDASVRREIANQVNEFDGDVLIWVSIPCTGGTSRSFVNMKHRTAPLKVKHHVKVFHR